MRSARGRWGARCHGRVRAWLDARTGRPDEGDPQVGDLRGVEQAARAGTSCSPPSTGSLRWPSGGCSARQPTKGSVETTHLQAYLDEFVFRFNRRTSRSRGQVFHRVLELAVSHEPVLAGVTHRHWNDHQRTARGDSPDLRKANEVDTPNRIMRDARNARQRPGPVGFARAIHHRRDP